MRGRFSVAAAGLALVSLFLPGCPGDSKPCADGAGCVPADPCHEGRFACGSGTCVDTGVAVADGRDCGNGNVCAGGACRAPCAGGAACVTAGGCRTGVLTCASAAAAPVCSPNATAADGTACGNGEFCREGACVPPTCSANQVCQPANVCATGATRCANAWAPPTCEVTGSKANGTPCGTGLVCSSGNCVAGDQTRPTVVARSPAPGATNVWCRDPITVTFSEPVAAASVTDATVLMSSGGVAVSKTLELSSDARTLTIIPLSMPAFPASIAVSLTGGITDVAGNALIAPPDPWRWDVPAWQALGTAPIDGYEGGANPSRIVTDAAAVPFFGIATLRRVAGGQRSVEVFAWRDGWGEPLWSRSGDRASMLYYQVSMDVNSLGDPAVVWTEEIGWKPSPTSIYASRWVSGSWTAPALLATTSETIRNLWMMIDSQDRVLAQWRTDTGLFMKRWDAEGDTWLAFAGDPARSWNPSLALLDVSLSAWDQPQVLSTTWDGTQWGFDPAVWTGSEWKRMSPQFCWLDGFATVASRATRRGVIYVGGYQSAPTRQDYVVRECNAEYLPVELGTVFTSPDGPSPSLLLDRSDRPLVLWWEAETLCGKRWTGAGWSPLASDGTCTGAPTGAVAAGGRSALVACDGVRLSEYFSGLRCFRHNEYVLPNTTIALESIILNETVGGSTRIPNPMKFRVAYTPLDATDKALTWKICTAQPTWCTPNTTGQCLTCTEASGRGTISGTGVYTPPASIPASPARVYVLACQRGICDWSFVDVFR